MTLEDLVNIRIEKTEGTLSNLNLTTFPFDSLHFILFWYMLARGVTSRIITVQNGIKVIASILFYFVDYPAGGFGSVIFNKISFEITKWEYTLFNNFSLCIF